MCINSCASVDLDVPQQAESTRAYVAPVLLTLSDVGLSSWDMPPRPQYTVASAQMRYFRSVRLKPRAFSSETVFPKLSSPVGDSWTRSTRNSQAASVTHRTCRTPPVSAALSTNI